MPNRLLSSIKTTPLKPPTKNKINKTRSEQEGHNAKLPKNTNNSNSINQNSNTLMQDWLETLLGWHCSKTFAPVSCGLKFRRSCGPFRSHHPTPQTRDLFCCKLRYQKHVCCNPFASRLPNLWQLHTLLQAFVIQWAHNAWH